MSASTAAPTTPSRRVIYFAYYPIRGTRRLAKLTRSVHPHTIGSNTYAFEHFFATSSVSCRYCDKPVVHIADIETCYSIIRPCFCSDGLDQTTDDFKHNESVAAILPPGIPTVCGAVLVFKHPPCDADIPGGTLPLLDTDTSDLPVTDEVMRRWIQNLFEPQELPPNTFVLPPPCDLPRHTLLSFQLVMSDRSTSTRSSVLSRQLAVAHARIAELEASLAALAVDEPSNVGAYVRHASDAITRPGPRIISLPTVSATVSVDASDSDSDTSAFTIPDSDDEAPPAPPPSAADPPSPVPTPTSLPSASRREYVYSSPTVPLTRTTEWSQAAENTQGRRNAQVRRVAPPSIPRKIPAVCWAVFRGRQLGVFSHWQLVQAATSGFRFAVFHGYPDIPSAERAYSYALAQGYTTTTAQERGLALPLARIPASILGANNSIDEARLLGRSEDEPWYIVYQGVNPGVYPTYLEAALNTNGVRLAAHDSRETLAQAVSAFQEARLRGEVHIRRETKSR